MILFLLLRNVKIVGILTFMSRKNFMLNRAEHGKSFITSGPVYPDVFKYWDTKNHVFFICPKWKIDGF